MIQDEHVARMTEMRIVCICYCKVRDKSDLERYKRRWEDDIKMDFKKIERESKVDYFS
jgi:hypothetical protein